VSRDLQYYQEDRFKSGRRNCELFAPTLIQSQKVFASLSSSPNLCSPGRTLIGMRLAEPSAVPENQSCDSYMEVLMIPVGAS
jgi:hypothetical protein